jgi:hypothetical protein
VSIVSSRASAGSPNPSVSGLWGAKLGGLMADKPPQTTAPQGPLKPRPPAQLPVTAPPASPSLRSAVAGWAASRPAADPYASALQYGRAITEAP